MLATTAALSAFLFGSIINLEPKPMPQTPVRAIHIVAPGESLNSISSQYKVLPWQLRTANRIPVESTLIRPGDELVIPEILWKAYEGKASYYGHGDTFHGKLRADGKTFDKNDILIAHRTFPLGMNVRITNLSNGKSIKTQVLDRGPYIKDENGNYTREVDLSYGAAKLLDAVGAGVIPVRIEPLE